MPYVYRVKHAWRRKGKWITNADQARIARWPRAERDRLIAAGLIEERHVDVEGRTVRPGPGPDTKADEEEG